MNDSIANAVRFESEWLFAATPDKVWPLLADTNRLNQVMGNPPVRFTDQPDPRGGIRREGAYTLHGIPLKWEELPYEWVEGKELGVMRRYFGGPNKTFAMRATLTPEGDATRVHLRIEIEPRNAAMRPLVRVVGRGVDRGFARAFRRLQDYLLGKVEDPYGPACVSVTEVQQARARQIQDRLARLGLAPDALEALVSHVLKASDPELQQLRPFELAKRWGTDRRDLLKVFLHATKAGLLELKWDLLCPGCRGARASHETLSGLAGKAHCPACNIDTTADFGQSVELSFRPNPAVRHVELHEY